MPFAWTNGQFVEESDASVSIHDTGLLHAAGVFTTMRSYSGRVLGLERHLARLRESSQVLFVPLQHTDEQLTAVVGELLQRNELRDARLRLTITRGRARQDPVHGLRLEPNVFLTATSFEEYPAAYYQKGMTVVLLDEQKLNPYDIQAGHKTLNYFSRLSALREVTRRGAGEALWFNVHNYLQSASVANVFMVKGGALVTPPTAKEMLDPKVGDAVPYGRSNVLPGVTRSFVMELAAKAGIEVRTAAINVNDLLEADELFLTNSIMQVMPVCALERKVLGDGQPGPVTRQLAAAFNRMVEQFSA